MIPPRKFSLVLGHADHPTLSRRKKLLWRFLAARVYLRLEDVEFPYRTDLEAVIDAAPVSVLIENDNMTLSHFLSAVTRSLDNSIHSVVQRYLPDKCDEVRSVLSDAISTLKADASHISCEQCSRIRGEHTVCNGTIQDERILESFDSLGAPCWRLINELFYELSFVAEEHYAPMLNGGTLTVRFCTRPTPRRFLGANAQFPPQDSGTRRSTSITLDLPDNDLDHTHIRELAYTLFHEIFVHGAESWLTAGRRTATTELCAFREGFVDAAAATVLQRYLAEHGLKSELYQPFSDALKRGTYTAHAQRLTYQSGGITRDDPEARQKARIVSARNRGWKLFLRFEAQFDQIVCTRLAACLNLLALSEAERDALLSALDRASDPKAFRTKRWRFWLEALFDAARLGHLSVAEKTVRESIFTAEF